MVQIWSLLQGAQGIYVILILAIAFAVVFGAPVYAVMNRDAFSYAITNRRIFVLNSVPFITHAVIEPHEIQHVSVSERKGKGTVYLFYYSLFASTFTHVQRQLLPTNKLSNIRDPHRAASLIREYLLPIKAAEEKRNAEEEAKKPTLNQGLFKPTKW